jgi:hypothetical protein
VHSSYLHCSADGPAGRLVDVRFFVLTERSRRGCATILCGLNRLGYLAWGFGYLGKED